MRLDVGLVLRVVARLRLEPAVEDLAEDRLRGGPQAESQDVRVVPGPRATRSLRVAAQRGAHTRRPCWRRSTRRCPSSSRRCPARHGLLRRLARPARTPTPNRPARRARARRGGWARGRAFAARQRRRAPAACPCRLRPRPSYACHRPHSPAAATVIGAEATACRHGVGISGYEGPNARSYVPACEDPTRVSDISYYRDSALSKAARVTGRRTGEARPARGTRARAARCGRDRPVGAARGAVRNRRARPDRGGGAARGDRLAVRP